MYFNNLTNQTLVHEMIPPKGICQRQLIFFLAGAMYCIDFSFNILLRRQAIFLELVRMTNFDQIFYSFLDGVQYYNDSCDFYWNFIAIIIFILHYTFRLHESK